MGSIPSIPNITTGQTSTPTSSMDIGQIQQMAGLVPMGPAPSTTVVNASQAPVVNVPHANVHQYQPEAVPFNNTSNEINRAKKSNNFRSITNALTAYTNKKSTEKTEALKVNITSVLASQKRISEAQTVLQNDPNNANAKAVLESNKKILDGLLGGKDGKAIQKAFDISFTDPQKNKTPEVSAGQAALKDFKQIHEQGHDINNPQEAAVAQAAGNVPSGQSGPQLIQRPGVQMNPGSNMQNVRPAPVSNAVVPGSQSNNSYADQFLGKQALELQANPQYAVYKEQLDARTANATKILPDLIRQQTQQIVEGMKQEGANKRAYARDLEAYQASSERTKAMLKMQGMRDSAAYKRVVRQGEDAFARAVLQSETRLGVSNDPRIKGTPLAQQMKLKGLEQWQTVIAKETKDINDVQAALDSAKANKAAPEKIAEIEAHLNWDKWNMNQLLDQRDKYTRAAFGQGELPPNQQTPSAPAAKSGLGEKLISILEGVNKSPLGYVTDPLGKSGDKNGNNQQSAQSTRPVEKQVVGDNLSDDEGIPAEEGDGDIDPDNYDQ